MKFIVNMPDADRDKVLALLAPQGELMREVVLDFIPRLVRRIHKDGLAADGTQIGTYSEEYMKVRTGNFGNTPKVSRGVNKGQKVKGKAGTVTKGINAGKPRHNFGHSSDTKVILVLTGAMEKDYVVAAGEEGWGVGFINVHSYEKATWNNTRYGKTIYLPTAEELERIISLTEQLISEQSSAIS